MYLDENPTEIPWDAIRYLIAEAPRSWQAVNKQLMITKEWELRACNLWFASRSVENNVC